MPALIFTKTGQELKKAVEKRAPKWLLGWLVSAKRFLRPGGPRLFPIWIPLIGGYLLFPHRFFSPDSGMLPDEDYFRILSPEKGGTVLDVGACIGFSALEALHRIGREGLLVAIEPDPENLKFLSMNLSRFSNCLIVGKGVGENEGSRILYRSFGPGGHTFYKGISFRSHPTCKSVRVRTSTIDRICEELGLERVDFMMMDVEGAELEALRGARKMLKVTRKVVVGAYHIVRGKPTYPKVERFLKRMGFQTVVTEDGLVHAWKVEREAENQGKKRKLPLL